MSGFIFDYTTGDPDNLDGGGDADMIDIQGSFFDIRAFLNSGVLAQLASSLYIVGEVRWLAGPPPDAAWIPCDFRSLTQSANTKLFNAIGTTYGPGDVPGSTFNVPDLRGRAAVGAGTGTGLTARAAGTRDGSEPSNMPSHNHNGGDHQHTPNQYLSNVGTAWAYAQGAGAALIGINNTAPSGVIITTQGGGNGGFPNKDNMPPFTVIPAYIYAGT